MADGDVAVNFTTAGGDEVVSQLRQIASGLEGLTSVASASNDGIGKVIQQIGQLTGIATIGAIGSVTDAIEGLAKYAGDAATSLADMAAGMVKAAAAQEQMLIGLTSLNEANNGWANAMGMAQKNLDALAAMSSNQPLGEMVKTFQTLTNVAGGTDSQILKMTQNLTLFAQANNTSAQAVIRLVEQIARTGTIVAGRGQNAGLAAALVNQLGGGDNVGQQIRRQSLDAGSIAPVLEQLKPTQDATDALTNSWTNLENAFQSSQDEITKLLGQGFEPLKAQLVDVTAFMTSPAIKAAITDLANDFKGLLGSIGDTFRVSPDESGITALFAPLQTYLKDTAIEWMGYATAIQVALASARAFASGASVLDTAKAISDIQNQGAKRVMSLGGLGDFDKNQFVGPPEEDPTHKGMSVLNPAAAQSASDAIQKMYQTIDTGADTAGLDSIDAKLAKITDEANKQQIGLLQLWQAWDKADPAAAHASDAVTKYWDEYNKIASTAATNRLAAQQAYDEKQSEENDKMNAAEVAASQKAAKEMLAAQDAFQNEMNSLNKAGAETTLQTIDDGYQAKEDALRKSLTKTEEILDTEQSKIQLQMAGLATILSASTAATDAMGLPKTSTLGPVAPAQNVLQPWLDVYDADRLANQKLTDDKIAMANKYAADVAVLAAQRVAAVKTETDLEAGNWDAYYADLIAKAQVLVGNQALSYATIQSISKQVATAAVADAQTFSDGWAAGIKQLYANLTSFGQDVAALMQSVAGQMTDALSSGFVDIMQGKFSDLANVLKNLWTSILGDFGKMLAQMLERWILTGNAMGGQGTGGLLGNVFGGGTNGGLLSKNTSNNQPWQITNAQADPYGGDGSGGAITSTGNILDADNPAAGSQGTPGSGGLGAYGGYIAGAAMFASALGSSFGSNGPSQMNLAGTHGSESETDFGGTAKFGSYVSAAATLIGGLAVAAAASLVAAGTLTVAAVAAAIPVVGWIAAALILIVGAVLSIINGPKEAKVNATPSDPNWNPAFAQLAATTSAGALDTFGATGESTAQRTTFDAGVTAALAAYDKRVAGGGGYVIHAGSAADLQADAKNLVTNIIPAEQEHALFGQTPSSAGATGLNVAGISGVTDFSKALIDPTAPIPVMLKALGFTNATIQNIADQIDVQGITAFQTYLTALVTIVSGFDTATANLSMTGTQAMAAITKSQNQPVSASFQTSADNLTELASELSQYTGQDQIDHAQTLLGLVNQRWADETTAITQLMGIIAQTTASAVAQVKAMSDALLTPDQTEAALTQKTIGGGDLAAAQFLTDPAALQTWFANSSADVSALFNILDQRLQEAQSLLASGQALVAQFDPATFAQAVGAMGAPLDQLTEFGLQGGSLIAQVNAAAKLSGTAQLTAIQNVQQAAASMYQAQMAAIQAIQSAVASLHNSIQSQIFGIELDKAGASGGAPAQEALLLNKIQEDYKAIGTAQSTAQVQALTQEIQTLSGQYLQLFPAGDKNLPNAQAWVEELLGNTETAADTKYAQLQKSISDAATVAQQALIASDVLLNGVITTTTSQITILQGDVTAFAALVGTDLTNSVNSIIATNKELDDALKLATTDFTGVATALNPAPKPDPAHPGQFLPSDGGLTPALTDTASSATTLKGKFDDATTAVTAFIAALGSAAPAASSSSKSTATAVLAMIKKVPALTAARTGNGA